MGVSRPSRAKSAVWLASPTFVPSRSFGRRILDGLPGLLVDDVEHVDQRPPDGLRQRPAGHRFGRWVQEGDQALGVGGDDGVADARQRHRIAALAGPQAVG